MTNLLAERTRTRTGFIQNYADDLRRWGNALADNRGVVVAIARKCPRLLELAAREELIPVSLLSRVTSERGLVLDGELPAAPPILVCDDIIIYGSTYKGISSVALEVAPRSKARGKPFAVSLRVDENALGKDIGFEVDSTTRLPAESCTSFENAEIASFALLDKPYDIDHPILYIDLSEGTSAALVKNALEGVARETESDLYETPRRLTLATGDVEVHVAWTLLSGLRTDPDQHSRLRKVRCYLDTRRPRIALVPIAPVDGSLQELESRAFGLPKHLASCWSLVRSAVKLEEGGSQELQLLRGRTLVAWANYLLELVDLGNLVERVRQAMLTHDLLAEPRRLYVERFDLQLLLGTQLPHRVEDQIDAYVNSISFGKSDAIMERPAVVSPVLPREYQQTYEQALADLTQGCADPAEVLSAIFRAQHVGIELLSRDSARPNPTRLEFGVPFRYLGEKAREVLGEADRVELNRAIDILIDLGVAVPRYLFQKHENVWFRSFRVGEGEDEIRGYVVRTCIEVLSSILGSPTLRETVIEKFLVLACDHLKLQDAPSLVSGPGIFRGFHLYGARPQVIVGEKNVWLTDWARDKRILKRVSEGRHPSYALDERSDRYFQRDGNPISPASQSDIAALARWTGEALAVKGLGTDFLVAITTVESSWAYQQALLAQLTGWTHDHRFGLTAALHALDDLVEHQASSGIDRLTAVFGELANWIAQARKKYSLFESLTDFLRLADKHWPADSYDDTPTTWRKRIRPVIEARSGLASRPANAAKDYLEPTLRVAGSFTTLLRNIASLHPGISRDDRAQPVDVSAERVVKSIEQLPVRLRDQFSEAIPGLQFTAAAASFSEAVVAVRKPAALIARAVDFAIRLFPDFSNDPHDLLDPGLYVVFWDVRRSAGDPTPEPLARRIMEVNAAIRKSLSRRLERFNEKSADDGQVAICRDFEAVMEIAEMLREGFGPDRAVKMGCDTNLDGALHRSRLTDIVSGRAFAYAARMMGFFKEITDDPKLWTPDDQRDYPEEPDFGSTYCVLSENAFRLAADSGLVGLLQGFQRLPGLYRARIYGAIRRDVYLRLFGKDATSAKPVGQ